MKPFSLSVLLLLSALAAQAEVVMVSGTVYDVGKGSYSGDANTVGGDSQMCWAATASNLLQHWQDEYLPASNTTVPNGFAQKVYTQPTGTRYLNIYNEFCNNFYNDGGTLGNAMTWYTYGYGSNLKTSGSGKYLLDYGVQGKEYVWGNNGYSNNFYSMAQFKSILDTAFQYEGYGVFIGFNVSGYGDGHAVTCWGYETDTSGKNVTALYISDSDDGQFGARRVELKQNADGTISLSSDYGNYSDGYNYTLNQVSYLSSSVAKNAKSDNTTLPANGVLTGAFNISGKTLTSANGVSAEAGSILAAAGDKTVLTLGPSSGQADGTGLAVKVGGMLTLDKTDLAISRFSGSGLTVAAEARLNNGTVAIADNGGDGVRVQGSESDVTTYLQMSGNTAVDASRNGGSGIYVEGRMLLHDNRAVSLSDNDGAGISVKGSTSTASKYTTGLSTLDATSNDSIEITGNKQGGIHVESYSSNGILYKGEVAFTGNGTVRLQGNGIEGRGGAIQAEGGVSFTGNTVVDISGNEATGGTGACGGGIASLRYGAVTLSKNGTVRLTGNSSTGKGGAIYTCSNLDITGSTKSVDINGNTAVNGAAVYADSEVISGYIYQSTVSIDHNAAVNIKNNVSTGANIIFGACPDFFGVFCWILPRKTRNRHALAEEIVYDLRC